MNPPPKWHRDEIILALDLYLDPYRGSIDARNPNILALSKILNNLPLFQARPDAEKFRNPNGVSLKMSNFLALDPTYEGKGMNSFSKLDQEVFQEYFQNRARLRKIANQIKGVVSNVQLQKSVELVEDDENTLLDTVQEGQVLYKLHKYRERNPKIIAAKKQDVIRKSGKLVCEVCDFDFAIKYGELGNGYIECHHKIPLSENESYTETTLEDLAVVCSNCHRMLHRRISTLSIESLRDLI